MVVLCFAFFVIVYVFYCCPLTCFVSNACVRCHVSFCSIAICVFVLLCLCVCCCLFLLCFGCLCLSVSVVDVLVISVVRSVLIWCFVLCSFELVSFHVLVVCFFFICVCSCLMLVSSFRLLRLNVRVCCHIFFHSLVHLFCSNNKNLAMCRVLPVSTVCRRLPMTAANP